MAGLNTQVVQLVPGAKDIEGRQVSNSRALSPQSPASIGIGRGRCFQRIGREMRVKIMCYWRDVGYHRVMKQW